MRTAAPTPQIEFDFPTVKIPQGDGSYLIRPGKPVEREELIFPKEAAKLLGCSVFSVYRYVDMGLLTARQTYKKARYRLKRSEVDALATKRRD